MRITLLLTIVFKFSPFDKCKLPISNAEIYCA